MSWKPGDTVQLKSGGPIMTVSSIGDQYGVVTVWCAWFDGKKQTTGTFRPEMLRAVDMED